MSDPVLLINGVHPADYASQWGDGSTFDGFLFYNCSSTVGRDVIANPSWSTAQWFALSQAILALLSDPTNIEAFRTRASLDYANLCSLLLWSVHRARGPQTFTSATESGQPLLTLTEAEVYSVPTSGPADDAVSIIHRNIPVSRIHADSSTIRAHLSTFGCWSAEDLADPATNLCRLIWLSASNFREEPSTYANP